MPPYSRTVLFALLLLAPWAGPRAEVREVGGRKQLFIDDRFIEQARGIELHMHAPVKRGMVMSGANAWEDGLVTGGGAFLEDGGRFRFWYTATPASDRLIEKNPFRLCYAESSDGIHWTKPNLGLYSWHGSKANNIIMETQLENGGGVFLDPSATADERYKWLARLSQDGFSQPGPAPEGAGLYIYTSPDGLHWRLHPKRVFPFVPDTVNMALYDDSTGKYLAYVRTWVDRRRRVGVVETPNILEPWPYDRNAPRDRPNSHVPMLEVPDAFGNDAGDPANIDHYTPAAVKYPWADGAYFLFPSLYRHYPPAPASRFNNDGPLDIQMALGRDGKKFHRVSRFPYVADGLPGSPDSGSMYMYVGMLRREAEIYQYYVGFDWTHAAYHGFPELKRRGSVMLLSQRLDGFVSARASEGGGEFVTPPLNFQGRRLALNVNASASGEARVELRTDDGKPIPGYTFADSDPIYENDVARIATWRRGDGEVGAWAGKPVRIAFRLQTADLYAFQFVP